MVAKIINLLKYGKWTNCKHGKFPEAWVPVDFADWQCPTCGVVK